MLLVGLVVLAGCAGPLSPTAGAPQLATPPEPATTPTPTATASPAATATWTEPATDGPTASAGDLQNETLPRGANTTRIIATVADTHYGDTKHHYRCTTRQAVEWLRHRDPDYLVHAGDVSEQGSADEWREARRDLRRVLEASPARRWWWTPGGSHDGFSGTAKSHSSRPRDIGLGALGALRNTSQSSLLYAVEIGNLAIVTVPTYQQSGADGRPETMVVRSWRDWLDTTLAYYDRSGYNVILVTHQPLVNTTGYSGAGSSWWGMDHERWRETSRVLARLTDRHDVDVLLAAHVHTDPETHRDGSHGAVSGKVVAGGRYPGMPNATIVSNGVVTYLHGGARPGEASYPALYTWRIEDGATALRLRAYDVRSARPVGLATNQVGLDDAVTVPLDDPVRLGPRSEAAPAIDGYRQGWVPVALPDERDGSREEWYRDGGLLVPWDGYWLASEWSWPTREVVPTAVTANVSPVLRPTATAASASVDHELLARDDAGNWSPVSAGGRPVDQLRVNSTVSLDRDAAGAVIYNISVERGLVGRYTDLALRDGTYVVEGVQSDATLEEARLTVRMAATVERVVGLEVRVAANRTVTLDAAGNTTTAVTATRSVALVANARATGTIANLTMASRSGPATATVVVGGLNQSRNYTVVRDGAVVATKVAAGGSLSVDVVGFDADTTVVVRESD